MSRCHRLRLCVRLAVVWGMQAAVVASPPAARPAARQYDRMASVCGPGSQPVSTRLVVTSVDECARLCDSHEDCGAFDSDGASCFLKRDYAAGNASDVCAHKGRWCGYRAVAPNSSLGDTLVVTQTHLGSPAAIRRFVAAQQSLRQAGARHYVAFLIGDEPDRDRCDDPRHPRARELRSLRTSLGHEAVWCIDPPAFSSRWPDFFAKTKQLPWMHPLPSSKRGKAQAPPHWRYRARNSLGWHWSWVNCDLPGLLGFLRFLPRSATAGVRWLWTIDWDVGWVGSLAQIVGSFSGAPGLPR